MGKYSKSFTATAILLAGGDSSRMGSDKSMLPINGCPAIEHILKQVIPLFDEVLISANDVDNYLYLGVSVIPDKLPGYGPLIGIASAMEKSRHDLNFVVACDIPFIKPDFIDDMMQSASDYDAVVPISDNGEIEPLFAIYNKSMLSHIQEALAKDIRKVRCVFKGRNVCYMNIGDNEWLRNLNTQEDYEQYLNEITETEG